VTAKIVIGGTRSTPQVSFTSTPTLPQDEVLSRLLFGSR
jgi:translocation and assembly module TamB